MSTAQQPAFTLISGRSKMGSLPRSASLRSMTTRRGEMHGGEFELSHPSLAESRSPNPRLQRTRVGPSGRRSPLSRQPLGDLAHRGAECGERSPGPGHGNSHSVAKYAAWWQWLSFHRGVARLASSWRIGWRSSSGTAPAAARQSSSRAHSSPNPRLQRTRSSASPPRSPLSRQPLGDAGTRSRL